MPASGHCGWAVPAFFVDYVLARRSGCWRRRSGTFALALVVRSCGIMVLVVRGAMDPRPRRPGGHVNIFRCYGSFASTNFRVNQAKLVAAERVAGLLHNKPGWALFATVGTVANDAPALPLLTSAASLAALRPSRPSSHLTVGGAADCSAGDSLLQCRATISSVLVVKQDLASTYFLSSASAGFGAACELGPF